ncbi:hypothetical protein QO010_004053 [Caulobacter ginsengisoli]|uniref:Uncharacterized protein n=1 Tax=Caulobacter ginsengisoli TaxID=400775 RepID=A0ABU0IY23_9CAUL|nr:hypothetical protein [Caulobacter ginsengisoli]MDQ0466260.1 hypothetical protein [Caulobacter ginsengisoli]
MKPLFGMALPARHLDLVLLAQVLLTLGLVTMTLLTPGGSPAAAPVEAEASAPPPARISEPRIAHPREAAAPTSVGKPAKTSARVSNPRPAPEPTAAPLVAVADMPETGGDYRKARRQLLARGFKPARVAPPECRGPEPSVDACWGALVQFPEIEICMNGARGGCVGWWLAPDGRVLRIQTAGETGAIRDRHWASSGELADLPTGWRP